MSAYHPSNDYYGRGTEMGSYQSSSDVEPYPSSSQSYYEPPSREEQYEFQQDPQLVPKPVGPTEAYLSSTLIPSTKITDPCSLRKLLVLDLNGTLVYREPYDRTHNDRDPYSLHPTQRPERPMHRRPYMGTFASYLFHAETREWLDTMIWSSAMPKSVQAMVKLCFGEGEKDLKDLWTRQSIGLSRKEYNQKTQTRKNLEKPWAQLSASRPSSRSSSNPPSSQTTPEPTPRHTALTTLLVDDSPDKAVYQPWNHLCILEYGGAEWDRDVQTAQHVSIRKDIQQQRSKSKKEKKTIRKARRAMAQAHSTFKNDQKAAKRAEKVLKLAAQELASEAAGEEVHSKKRKRKKLTKLEKHVAKAKLALVSESIAPAGDADGEEDEDEEGVEEEPPPSIDAHDAQRIRKKHKLSQPSDDLGEIDLNSDSFSPINAGGTTSGVNSEEESLVVLNGNSANITNGVGPSTAEAEPYDAALLALIGILEVLRTESNVAGWMRNGGLQVPGSSAVSRDDDPSKVLASGDSPWVQWFSDPPTLAYWTRLGREACRRLGVRIEPNISLPSTSSPYQPSHTESERREPSNNPGSNLPIFKKDDAWYSIGA